MSPASEHQPASGPVNVPASKPNDGTATAGKAPASSGGARLSRLVNLSPLSRTRLLISLRYLVAILSSRTRSA